MVVKLNLIVAVCENMGIGVDGKLPWKLKVKKSRREYYLLSAYAVLDVGDISYLIKKNKKEDDNIVKYVVAYEDLYDHIHECHLRTDHGGSVKMRTEFQKKYSIPRPAVDGYLKFCQGCSEKKTIARTVAKRPISSRDYNEIGQVDLLDYTSIPDGNYNWILSYHDHFTKFVYLRPLQTNRTTEVAEELLKIFLTFGAPRILRTVSGQEFANQLILELKQMWPKCLIENDQSSVKRITQDIDIKLRTWLTENNSDKWSIGLHFVQWQKNTSLDKKLGRSPYRALFRCNPKVAISDSKQFQETETKVKNEVDLELNDEDVEMAYSDEDDMETDECSTEKKMIPEPELLLIKQEILEEL